MKMNLKPALRYQLIDLLQSSLAFLLTIAAITAIIPIMQLFIGGDRQVSLGGYVIIAAIYLFVMGIAATRAYLRLNVQMGISRGTGFTAQLIATVIISLILSVVGELLSATVQAFSGSGEMLVMDLFQMMYNDGAALSFSGHLLSICFNTCLCVYAYVSGMFFTLLFWRLNTIGIVIVTLAMVVLINLLFNAKVLSPVLPLVSRMAIAFFDEVEKGPGALIIFFLASSAALALIEWLLLRKANIRAAAN